MHRRRIAGKFLYRSVYSDDYLSNFWQESRNREITNHLQDFVLPRLIDVRREWRRFC